MSKHSEFKFTSDKWSGVWISPLEAQRLYVFIQNHVQCNRDVRIFTSQSSGIGQNLVVDCTAHTKESQTDITDYRAW